MDETEILQRVERAAARLPSNRIVALYAIGSLGHGGFSPLASDVDLALVLDEPSGEIAAELRGHLRDVTNPVSVFWDSLAALRRETYSGRFPACDRWDLRENGRLIHGREIRDLVPRPDVRDLVRCAIDLSLQMLSRSADVPGGTIDATALLLDPPRLAERGPRDASKIVLLPIRFLFTLRTARIARLDEAVALLLRDAALPRRQLVEAALGWRTEGIADRERMVELCRAALVPIYLELVDAHCAWLLPGADDADRERIQQLKRWRERLSG